MKKQKEAAIWIIVYGVIEGSIATYFLNAYPVETLQLACLHLGCGIGMSLTATMMLLFATGNSQS